MNTFKKKNRSAYLNFLRSKYDAYTLADSVRSYPHYLTVDPSDTCQLRCPTCPTGRENEGRKSGKFQAAYRRERGSMKPELFDALLDELGPYLFFIMFYNWGEPLLNKSLASFVAKAHRYDIETEIHSNLSLPLSQRRIDELLDSGLDGLVASIDGFSQAAYEIHRVGGDIALVKKNLEALAETRDRLGSTTRIVYKMLIFSHNEHEIEAAKQYCKDLGIEFVRNDASINDESWLPSYRKGEEPTAPMLGDLSLKELVAFALWADDYFGEDEQERVWSPRMLGESRVHPPFCSWHYGVSVVTAGGALSPCCATAKERDDFGRLVPGETRFSDVWNDRKYRHARSVARRGAHRITNAETDTLCDHCFYPGALKHLYDVLDAKVIASFHHNMGADDGGLAGAFRLFAHLRYGRVMGGLLRRGVLHPMLQFLGQKRDAGDMSPFVEFYRQHLAAEATPVAESASPPSPRRAHLPIV